MTCASAPRGWLGGGTTAAHMGWWAGGNLSECLVGPMSVSGHRGRWGMLSGDHAQGCSPCRLLHSYIAPGSRPLALFNRASRRVGLLPLPLLPREEPPVACARHSRGAPPPLVWIRSRHHRVRAPPPQIHAHRRARPLLMFARCRSQVHR